MVKPILYSFRRCPYAMRARLALDVAEIEVEHREIELKNKPASMLQYSPKGTVPVLVDTNGQVIDESLDIMLWALQKNDPEHWLHDDAEKWFDFVDRFKPLLDRAKYPNRYPDEDTSQAASQAAALLITIEDTLAKNTCLIEPKHTIADYAVLPFLRQFYKADETFIDKNTMPRTVQWIEDFMKSERFLRVMKKHSLWVELIG